MNETKKPFPAFRTDEEMEAFVDSADLGEYDFSGFRPASFEFQPKDSTVTLRLSAPLLDAIKAYAKQQGMPYQRFMRAALEKAVTPQHG